MTHDINKVIILVETTFNARDYKRFGVETLLKNGFDVYVFDLTPLVHPKFYQTVVIHDAISYVNHQYISSMYDFTNELEKLKDGLFILNFIPFRSSVYQIYKLISRLGIPYGIFSFSTVVFDDLLILKKLSFLKRFIRKIKRIRLANFKNYMITYMPLTLLGLESARYVFRGASKSNIKAKVISKNTEVVMIHALDYDNYLDNCDVPFDISNSIIFLDQNIPDHSDQLIQSTNNRPKSEEYYPELCNAFDKIERFFDTKIIVSCHPRADVSLLTKYYDGRNVLIGKTIDFVRNCNFCIAHYSSSINYAVMYDKPIVFITTNSLERSSLAYKVSEYAKYFNKRLINVSNDFAIDKKVDLYLDENIYKQYMYDFIKSENSADGKFWEIVTEKIKLI